MKLELIGRQPTERSAAPPLLFIHGANSGAWVWAEHMLDDLADRGFQVHAVSLRGHGDSDGRDRLASWSLADYVEDIVKTVGLFTRPPILIGHSMGGMVVQKYLQTHSAAGAILMASVPPLGLLHTSYAMASRNPFLLQQISLVQMIGPVFPGAMNSVRRLLFSEDTPAHVSAKYAPLWQPESLRAAMDMMAWNLPWRPRTDVPVFVLGGELDQFTPPNLVAATAQRYGAPYRVLPGIAHAMMLEPRWRDVSDAIEDWVGDQFRVNESAPRAGRPTAVAVAAAPA